MDEEALRARELIVLTRNDVNGEFFLGQVRSGKLEVLGGLVLVLLDLGGACVVAARLEFFDRVLCDLVFILAWRIVIGCHGIPLSPSSRIARVAYGQGG